MTVWLLQDYDDQSRLKLFSTLWNFFWSNFEKKFDSLSRNFFEILLQKICAKEFEIFFLVILLRS